jgi:thymidylate synthase (FAD)
MESILMSARIIAVTQPTIWTDAPGEPQQLTVDEFIAYVARVSNPGNQLNVETSDKLIGYLIKHKHWSPLEMASACIEITTTRDIGRQILRHRSFSFQEFSQRYAAVDTDRFVLREARLQDFKNKQNSIEIEDDQLQSEWNEQQLAVIAAAKEAYEWALSHNIAKEQARVVLPEGLTNSTMYVNGTIRSWIHYIKLRSSNGTQKEHRLIAEEAKKVFSEQFPTVSEALGWSNENV